MVIFVIIHYHLVGPVSNFFSAKRNWRKAKQKEDEFEFSRRAVFLAHRPNWSISPISDLLCGDKEKLTQVSQITGTYRPSSAGSKFNDTRIGYIRYTGALAIITLALTYKSPSFLVTALPRRGSKCTNCSQA